MFAMLENDVLDKVNPVWYVVGIIKTRGYVYPHRQKVNCITLNVI